MDEKIKAFLDDIEKVYKKYNLSISHEDGGGAFIIEDYDETDTDWLRSAHIEIGDRVGYILNGNIKWR